VAVFAYQRFVDARLTPEELEAIRVEKFEQAKAEAREVQDEDESTKEEQQAVENLEPIADVAQRYPDKLVVRIATVHGPIVLELFADKTPVTVASFVNLIQHKFYDGLVFHRVIPDFMIQGGCPLGRGTGDPGYKFEDEIVESLTFDRPGLLAMANSGPSTNGSQFFITHNTHQLPVHLNGKHTIFGAVLEGQDVVDSVGVRDKMIQLEVAGDFSGLLESQKDRVAEWTKMLGS
jgi:peptidyl-prolyl cis-trans isomerase B (cyclophilin B)